MRKIFKKVCALALVCALTVQPMTGSFGSRQVNAVGVADKFAIPAADANGRVGAIVPYTRYDSLEAKIGDGASIVESKDMAQSNIASQASERSYVNLPSNGSYAEWTMHTTGDGVTMRFTMPDSADGMGLNGSLDVYVNGVKQKTIKLSSYWMWQYGNHEDTPGAGAAQFAFDEVHFKLDKPLKENDTIRIQSTKDNGLVYGIDFIEVENVPDAIEEPDNAINVEDYGAIPDDGKDDYQAIQRAMEVADAADMDLYFPEGTFHIDQIWRVYASNMKITGAGMWYTNIQFTNSGQGMGGISGGWDQVAGSAKDDYCNNIEFCNMYINSNLRSRYGENAVYKCFMDVWREGSVIHDIWEDHFECGFWFGDYNGKMSYSDYVKVIDCRIRNNFADGVNFCNGTSNAVVYNCDVRNNGDDGLAMWNNNYQGSKDEVNNVFAYNTIELIWRAGGIAIYGGDGHKIYNNYIRDTFMAAGIHVNDRYDGYKYENTKQITFDNNILVRCGTSGDVFDEDKAAVDVKGTKQLVQNVTFNNTQIYDSPHEGTCTHAKTNNVVFNNTQIYGAGLDGQTSNWDAENHTGVGIRVSEPNAVYNGVQFINVKNLYIAPLNQGGDYNRQVKNVEIYEDEEYTLPVPPDPQNNEPGGGLTNPLEGITGYDVELTGLAWKNQDGSSVLKEGDKVTFIMQIKNTSNVDIPEKVSLGVKVTVDGKGSYINPTDKTGLKAGETREFVAKTTWPATAGGHTIEAVADYQNKLPDELSENNNTRTKKVNVQANPNKEPEYTKVTGGCDIVVLDVTWDKEIINVGDKLTFTATIVNAGDQPVPTGSREKLGISFLVDGKTWPDESVTWNDQHVDDIQPNQIVKLTATGGVSGSAWTAKEGTHTVTVLADDQNWYSDLNRANNTFTKDIEVPFGGIKYFDNPDSPDDLTGISGGEQPTKPQEPTTKPEEPEVPGITISKDVNIVGYQISSTITSKDSSMVGGSRVVASAEPTVNGKKVEKSGLVFAISQVNGTSTNVKDSDIYVGSENNYVASEESTDNGTLDKVMGTSKTARYYVMTTLFSQGNASEFNAKYKVRAYALLSDGTYVYSNAYSYSVYDIASSLYQGKKMQTYSGHDFLYEKILKVVNSSYTKVDYNWSDIVVRH